MRNNENIKESDFPRGYPHRGKRIIRKMDELLEKGELPEPKLRKACLAANHLREELSREDAFWADPDDMKTIYDRDLDI